MTKEYKLDSCLDHSDQFVISGSEDSKVYFWDMVTGKVAHRLDHGQVSTGFVAIHKLYLLFV